MKRRRSVLQALDGMATAGSGAAAAGPATAEQHSKAAAAAQAAVLLQQPGAEALWSAANIPDVRAAKGRKQNLLRGDGKALCTVIAPAGAKAVAVVGNGPLTDDSRADIAAADAILRFNEMNNRWAWRPGWRCRRRKALSGASQRCALSSTHAAESERKSESRQHLHAGCQMSGWTCGSLATTIGR